MSRLFALVFAGCAARVVAPSPPDAAKILAESAHVYASAKTYVDRGTATTSFKADHPYSRRLPFQTAFVRGGRFRFEFRDGDDPDRAYVVWSDGKQTMTAWYVEPGLRTGDSLDMAIAGATGVSSATANTVPTMLMPELGGGAYKWLGNPELEGTETVAGHVCWRIKAVTRSGGSDWLWIDRDSKLLRRIRSVRHFPAQQEHRAFDTDRTTDYEPSLDGPVAEELFRRPEPVVRRRPSWIGVRPDPSSSHLRSVVPGAPASRAGLQTGDEIVSIDGQAIANGGDIVTHTRTLAAGKPAKFVVRRGSAELSIDVTPEPIPDEPTQALIGKPAPPVPGTRFDGHVVLVEFWATWCGPCELTAPRLEALHQRYSDLRVIGVSDESAADATKYFTDHKLTYALALDPDDTAARDYLVQALPTIIVIDKTGIVRYAQVGVPDFADLEQQLAKLLH